MDAGLGNIYANKSLAFRQNERKEPKQQFVNTVVGGLTAAGLAAHGVPYGDHGQTPHFVNPKLNTSHMTMVPPVSGPASGESKDEGEKKSDPHAEIGEEKIEEGERNLREKRGDNFASSNGRGKDPDDNPFGGPFNAPRI